VTLAKTGYGSKASDCRSWPRAHSNFAFYPMDCSATCGRSGAARGRSRSSAVPRRRAKYQLTLWLYRHPEGIRGADDRLDRRACPQANRPDTSGWRLHADRREWNSDGYPAPPTIVAPERSGLYYLWARTPSGRAFHFPWVWRRGRRGAKIAVLASTNTWNAYNNFGGRSNYVNPAAFPYSRRQRAPGSGPLPEPAAVRAWRLRMKSMSALLDRPEPKTTISSTSHRCRAGAGPVQCGQAPGEWRLYGWLEREGFDYDLYRRRTPPR